MAQVYVPAGKFAMGNDLGAPDQRPMHMLDLDAFWIDRTEVTNAMYGLCVTANVCAVPLQTRSLSRPNYYGNDVFANYPVLFVNGPRPRPTAAGRDAGCRPRLNGKRPPVGPICGCIRGATSHPIQLA